jgi:hypothetical protein
MLITNLFKENKSSLLMLRPMAYGPQKLGKILDRQTPSGHESLWWTIAVKFNSLWLTCSSPSLSYIESIFKLLMNV